MTQLDRNMQLTDHFDIGEFLVSAQYPALADALQPSPVQVTRAYLLCATILEPARAHLNQLMGKPEIGLFITSGIRSPELNRAVKGSKTSGHMVGGFCDFIVGPVGHVGSREARDFGGLSKCKQNELLRKVFNFMRDELPHAWIELKLTLRQDEDKSYIHVGLPYPGRKRLLKVVE